MKKLKQIEEVLADGQAADVAVLPTEVQSGGLFTHIVIATAGSARHSAALTARLRRAMKSGGGGNPSVEESAERDWTLVDCGDIVVHIFQAEARQLYQLESLWGFEEARGN